MYECMYIFYVWFAVEVYEFCIVLYVTSLLCALFATKTRTRGTDWGDLKTRV